MARPRTPTLLKVVNGTAQPCRINDKEPQPDRGVPKPPEHLSQAAARAWDKVAAVLDRMAVLTEADGIALEEVCETYAELAAARAALRDAGETFYEGGGEKSGTILRPHPLVTQISDASRRLGFWLGKFGLTPADRSKVCAADGEKEDDPWAKL